MAEFLLIESRDPFDSADTGAITSLAADLSSRGHEVVVFLVQNGVLPARRRARGDALTALARGGVTVLAEEFSLHERGIRNDQLAEGIHPAKLDTVIDALADGARALWH